MLARAGSCALVGRPNVGKSTLLNRLVGQKLSAVSSRPGTSRVSLLGVYFSPEPPTQIAFLDTPGLVRARNALGDAMRQEANRAAQHADLVVMVTEPARAPANRAPASRASENRAPAPRVQMLEHVHAEDQAWLDALRDLGRPAILAVNKVDALRDKRKLLPTLTAYEQTGLFEALIPISALEGTNVDALIAQVRRHLKPGMLYEPDMLTDRPERFLASELIREAVFHEVHREVPYGVAVAIEQFEQLSELVRIHATIVVEKPSHKGIVLGKGGSRIKAIGTAARLELQEMLQKKVFVKLWVKVVEGWTRHPARVRELVQGQQL